MRNIKIVTDSSSDLSLEYYEAHDIDIVPFFITFDKQTYYREHADITIESFYKKLRNENVYPSTSTPNDQHYRDVFQNALDRDMDIICVCLTSKFSTSCQSAILAMNGLLEEYPDRKITVIDSIQAHCGQGLLLNEIVKLRDKGFAYDEIVTKVEARKQNARVFLTVDTLEYLSKGGRVGKVAALAGSVLNIKPVIVMKNGELNPACKVRGRQKSVQKLYDLAVEYMENEKDKYDVVVAHADCIEEADALNKRFRDEGYTLPFGINRVGVTIGTHAGPTMTSISIIKRITD